MPHPRHEIETAVDAYLARRRDAIAGRRPWTALAEVFTDDAVIVDSVWGRHEGRDAVVAFLRDSMSGLEDWDFPHLWCAIDGDRVFLRWTNRLPGRRADGSPYDVPGLSILEYAGDGLFRYEEDLYSEHEAKIKAVARELGLIVEFIDRRKVRPYAPRQFNIAIDFKVE